ncbi:hypothetical protein D3C76_1383880 [compost metagenome]
MNRQQSSQVFAIALTHFGRKRDQRGPVIQPGTAGQIICAESEDIATPDLNGFVFVALEGAMLRNLRFQLLLLEEVLHCPLRQLHPKNAQALACQPNHVQALATEGH